MRVLTLATVLALVSSTIAWNHAGSADRTERLAFYAVLEARYDELEARLLQVSDPAHPLYGKHMTAGEIGATFGASQSVIDAASRWFRERAVDGDAVRTEVLPTRDRIRVECTVASARSYFGTDLHAYHHPDHPDVVALAASSPPAVPAELAGLVRSVWGLSRLPALRRRTQEHVVALDAQTSTSGPALAGAGCGDRQLSLTLRLTCQDGSLPSSLSSPCADASGGPVRGAVATVTSPSFEDMVLRFPGDSLSCAASPNATVDARPVCSLTSFRTPTLPLYAPLTVGNMTLSFDTDVPVAPPLSPLAPYCHQAATPQLLRTLYSVPADARGGLSSRNRVGIASFLGEFYDPVELAEFHKVMGLGVPPPVTQRGPNNASVPGYEASLDVQALTGIAPNVPLTVYSTAGGSALREPYMEWLHDLDRTPDDELPQVISASYGDDEEDWTEEHMQDMQAINVEFMKAGLRGVTLLFSAGDDGVVSFTQRGKNESACHPFHPEFPASSPYVTAVGGTELSFLHRAVCDTRSVFGFDIGCLGPGERVASGATGSVITSGGGFSTAFQRGTPATAWQESAVTHYLDTQREAGTLPSPSDFASAGRGYPDVSALAVSFPVFVRGGWRFLYGTSASAPTMAGLLTLINDARLANGQPPLGFLNPWLYSLAAAHPDAFHDVTRGDIACTVHGELCCPSSFRASPGWDAASGWGSPDFGAWLRVALNPDLITPAASVTAAQLQAAVAASGGDDDLDHRTHALTVALVVLYVLLGLLGTVALVVVLRGRRHRRAQSHTQLIRRSLDADVPYRPSEGE